MSLIDFLKSIGIIPTKDNPNFNPQPEATPAPVDPKPSAPTPIEETVTMPTPTIPNPTRAVGGCLKLGDVVAKYESGSKGYKAISNTPGDPGGPSYGKYQLATNTGNVTAFLNFSGFANSFSGMLAGTAAFNAQWVKMCDNSAFCDAQHAYILQKLYQPVRSFANSLGLPSTAAINETLWSMAVQHGRAKEIVTNAGINGITDETAILNKLYTARRNYVNGLGSLNSTLKASLMRRYDSEIKDVLAMRGRNG